MKIAVVGEVCKDVFVYGSTSRLDPAAPAPITVPNTRVTNLGMAGNVYENLKALGVESSLFSNSNLITKTRYLDDRTNHLLLRVDTGDQETKAITNRVLNDTLWSEYDAVIISDYNKGFVTPYAISYIASHNSNTFLDTKKKLDSNVANVSYIKINSFEYEATKNEVSKLDKDGYNISDKLIVTTGSKGCRLKNVNYPVEKVEVKDQTGAGDTFLAAFTVKYMETRDESQAAKYANDCATKVVTKRGVVTL